MDDIPLARLIVLKGALKLEILGMQRSRSPSAYMMVKEALGIRGSRESVLKQLEEYIFKAKQIPLPLDKDGDEL